VTVGTRFGVSWTEENSVVLVFARPIRGYSTVVDGVVSTFVGVVNELRGAIIAELTTLGSLLYVNLHVIELVWSFGAFHTCDLEGHLFRWRPVRVVGWRCLASRARGNSEAVVMSVGPLSRVVRTWGTGDPWACGVPGSWSAIWSTGRWSTGRWSTAVWSRAPLIPVASPIVGVLWGTEALFSPLEVVGRWTWCSVAPLVVVVGRRVGSSNSPLVVVVDPVIRSRGVVGGGPVVLPWVVVVGPRRRAAHWSS
jgi:hypothetical protein